MLVCVNGERDSIQSDSLVSLCFGGNNSPAAICCCCWLSSFVPVCMFCFLFRVGRCRVRNRKGGNKEKQRKTNRQTHTDKDTGQPPGPERGTGTARGEHKGKHHIRKKRSKGTLHNRAPH